MRVTALETSLKSVCSGGGNFLTTRSLSANSGSLANEKSFWGEFRAGICNGGGRNGSSAGSCIFEQDLRTQLLRDNRNEHTTARIQQRIASYEITTEDYVRNDCERAENTSG